MSALGKRLGYALAARLMTKFRDEERQHDLGLRDDGHPSEALTEIQRRLSLSEFTPEERARIRYSLGIDPLVDIGGLPGGSTSQDSETT
jgi:hypothetical protein